MKVKQFVHTDFPQQLIIELTAACNQRCTFCGRTFMQRAKKTMSPDVFRKIVREVAAESPTTEVWPTFMGEATLLRGTTFALIKEAKEMGCQKVTLNTNGSLLDDRMIQLILDSGVDRFIVSMDAFTEETHTKVRPAANPNKNSEFFKRMWQGTEKLVAIVRGKNLQRPLIEVQFSVFDENAYERDQFREYWLKRGAVVKERPKLLWTGEVLDKPSEAFYQKVFEGGVGEVKRSSVRMPCQWAFDTCAICWDGSFAICAVDAAGIGCSFVNANAQEKTVKEVWNGPLKQLREVHRQYKFDELPQPCLRCPDWQTKQAVAYFPDEETKKNYEAYVRMGRVFYGENEIQSSSGSDSVWISKPME